MTKWYLQCQDESSLGLDPSVPAWPRHDSQCTWKIGTFVYCRLLSKAHSMSTSSTFKTECVYTSKRATSSVIHQYDSIIITFDWFRSIQDVTTKWLEVCMPEHAQASSFAYW